MTPMLAMYRAVQPSRRISWCERSVAHSFRIKDVRLSHEMRPSRRNLSQLTDVFIVS
jgi:hypothetical protein